MTKIEILLHLKTNQRLKFFMKRDILGVIMNKVALITGASSGIGLETALSLLKKGFTVYGAARRLSLMKKIEENGGTILYLDLTDDNSIVSPVEI